MTDVVSTERRDGVLVVTADNPPVNALSHAVRAGLVEALTDVGDATAVVLACAGRTFFAGADIREFGKPPEAPSLPEVIAALEACPVPVVAAIHGGALGGGLETALGCDYRIAARDARVGFPEIELGIFPGAGGTQRAPRLIGIDAALGMILDGKPLAASKAKEAGLIDEIATDDLMEAAIAFAKARPDKRRIRDLPAPEPDPDAVDRHRAQAAKKRRGQIAPDKAIAAVEASTELDLDAGLERERDLFAELVAGPHARAMRHLFFAERQAAKVDGLEAKPRTLGLVGVVGAGTMGAGIAMAFADAGFPVRLLDAEAEALAAGLSRIEAQYEATAKKGRISEAEALDRTDRIQPAEGYSGFADCDLVIEAVFESMDVKKAVFAELDSVCRADAVLATNTSYLDVDVIAASTRDPSRVLGMHFFSPANVMRLLEIVRGAKTADDVLATALDAAKRIRKIGVVAGVCPGFIGNRMLKGYAREAGLCMIEGAAPEAVDAALYEFGMPMGPFAMGDMAGLDIGYANRKPLTAGVDYEPLATAVHDRLVESGRKGQKTGAGFYRYEEGSRTPVRDPEISALIENVARENGVERREVSADEIVERCVLALVNEGANVLAEGVAQRASDIDVVWANGYGFPRWRGGPMFYGDVLGLDHVLERVRAHADGAFGKWWTPAPLIETLAASGGRLADWRPGS